MRLAGHSLLDAALPQTCVISNEWLPSGTGQVSPEARDALEARAVQSYCPRCARSARPETMYDGGCGGCRKERFWNVAEIVRIGAYDAVLRGPLLKLKYAGREGCARYLADMLARPLRRRPWTGELDALVPVPSHWIRRWQRPCDHATVLAAEVSKRIGIPVMNAVRRVKYGPSQVRATTVAQRFENVAGCFGMRRRHDVGDMSVCIVDNLVTSGATLHEVSKVLRAAGAKRIYAAVAARTTNVRAPQPT